MSKKADVALGALSVMAERENVIDFTVPYYDLVGISILMKKPKVRMDYAQVIKILVLFWAKACIIIDFTVPYSDLVGISILMKKPKVRRDHDYS